MSNVISSCEQQLYVCNIYSFHKIRGKIQCFDSQINCPSIHYAANRKAIEKNQTKIQNWHKETIFGVNKQITEVGFYKYALKNGGKIQEKYLNYDLDPRTNFEDENFTLHLFISQNHTPRNT